MLRFRWWQWLVLLLLLVVGTSWLISSRASQPSSSPSSVSLLRLEFRAPEASIKIKTTPTTQQALELILTEIGYGQSWHYFFLPHELHPQSLEPHSLVLEFLPIEQYSPQLHPFVVDRAVDLQGKLLSGTGCQYRPDSNQLHCLLFSSYDFASAPNQPSPIEFVTFSVVRTLLLLSGQLDDVRAQELGFTKLHQRLQQALDAKQLQLVALDQTEAKRFPLNAVAALFNQFKIESVHAYGTGCTGSMECKVVQEVCKCPGESTVCNPIHEQCNTGGVITDCADNCVRYCNGPWEKLGPFYCEQESRPMCHDPYNGSCGEGWAGDTSGTYCATRGNCYPDSGPTSPPNSTPSPTPPNYIPPPEPTSPPTHSGCGCCDSDDWSPDDGCYERNGRQGLQCCCGTGSCYRSPDGACLDNPILCPRNQEVYWKNPVAGYVFDQEGEPVPGVEVEVTVGGGDLNGINYYNSMSFFTDITGQWATGWNIYDDEGKWKDCEGVCFDTADHRIPIRVRVKEVPLGFDLASARTALSIRRVEWNNDCYTCESVGSCCMNKPPEKLSPRPYPDVSPDSPADLYYGGDSCTWVHPAASESQEKNKPLYLFLPAGAKYYACQTLDVKIGGGQTYNFIIDSNYPKVINLTTSTNEICLDKEQPPELTLDATFQDNSSNPTQINDIKIFQVNLELQTDPTLYDPLVWPIRIMVDRSTGNNVLTIVHPPVGGDTGATLIQDGSQPERYYLPANRELSRIFRVIGSADPTQASYITVTPTHISAHWKIQLLESFPNTTPPLSHFYVNGYVEDFSGLQHRLQYLTFPPPIVVNASGTDYYFHRRASLTITTPAINLSYFESDSNETLNSDRVCENTISSPPSIDLSQIPGATFRIKPATGDDSTWVPYGISIYQELEVCGDFDIELILDPADGFICNCGTGFDNFTCRYEDVPNSYADTDPPISFYLLPIDLTHEAWVQAVGGQLIAQNNVNSVIPFDGVVGGPCHPAQACWPALVSWSPWTSSVINTPGFVYAGSTINTGNDISSLIHSPSSISLQRSQSQLGHALGNDLFPTQYNYQYFFNRLGHLAQPFSSFNMPNIPSDSDLSVWLYQPASPGEPLVINETNNWVLNGQQKAVIFVNGDMRIEDSTPSTPDQIITVPNTQNYLAFVVSGAIEIDSSVGYTIPGGLPQAFALPGDVPANVEGIFLADQTITVESLNDPDVADKKFIGAGTFVGWSGVNLERSFSDSGIGQAWHNYNPTETFIYRPDFLVNAPLLMKEAVHEWREVAPKTIE